MPPVIRSLMFAACLVFCAPLAGMAQYRVFDSPGRPVTFPAVSSGTIIMGSGTIVMEGIDLIPATPFGGLPAMSGYTPGYPGGGVSPMTHLQRSRTRQTRQWTIPVGEYGLELANGMRMVGRPSKDWVARIATGFGVVVIPLTQIAQIAPATNGQFSVLLKNGDRVTGSLVSNTMRFESKFGTLSIAAADITRLRSSSGMTTPQPVAGRVPGSPSAVKQPGVNTFTRPSIGPAPPVIFRSFRRPGPK